MREKRTNPMLG